MSYLRYLSTILLTLTMFYGWASPSVATSQFVCRGVGLTEPERSSLWNLSDVSTLDKAGLNLAPRYVATSVHDGDSVRTIISEIIDGRRMRYLVDGSNLIWIGEETPEMHIMVDTLCYTSALLPFGDVSIPLSLHYRSNVIRSDGALVQSATYYPYGTPHRAPKNLTAVSTTNSYLFGGKELMTQDALDEYLYGARTYLPAATIFSSIDPLCEKYYHLSPYVFCAANPIRYVDPSGARIFLSQDMNLKQIFTVLLDLQRLTDDKLVYQTQSDGRRMIKIAKLGKGKHTKGTQLIRNLNSSFRSVEIEYDKASLDRTGKYTSRFRTYYEDGVNLKNKNALINYAPSQNVKTRTAASTPKGYAFRSSPTRVSLAHELIHAYHATKGDVETTTAENPTYIINGKKVVVSGNVAHKELRTVGLGFNHQGDITENDIRIEQGLPF